jgi:hypothetical protein
MRGVKFVQEGFEETFCTDHWRSDLNQMMEILEKPDYSNAIKRSVGREYY